MMLSILITSLLASSEVPVAELEAEVQALFDDHCSSCHDGSGPPGDPETLDLAATPASLVGQASVVNGRLFVVPGQPSASYLLAKLDEHAAFDGDLMPPDDEPLTAEQRDLMGRWVTALAQPSASAPPPSQSPAEPGGRVDPPVSGTGSKIDASISGTASLSKSPKNGGNKRADVPFFGVQHVALPTTTTLGKRVLQYRIDHRFGRLGTERGFFGLDVGAIMSFGLAYGLLPGWDIRLRRTNSHKGWELGSKYIFLRQEEGRALSLGGYVSMAYFHEKDVLNPLSGSFVAMISRLWWQRWATMFTVSYHLHTNHATDPMIESDDRGTLTVGLASSVRVGKRKRWSIDAEYVLPIPAGNDERGFYTRTMGEASGTVNYGVWSIAGSLRTKMHQFQILISNNREIHTSLVAPGGQTRNPFKAPGVEGKNPFRYLNFYVGFNLIRKFKL